MHYKNLLAGLAAGLLLYAQAGLNVVLAAVPPDAPKDVKHIFGLLLWQRGEYSHS